MTGKDKCKILKDIRKKIAEENDIEWIVSECSHKGDCKGTCPKCEGEVRKLERELSLRRKIGKAVALTGVSAACLTGLTACTMDDVIDMGTEIIEHTRNIFNRNGFTPDIEGDVPMIIEDDGAIDIDICPDGNDIDVMGEVEYIEPEGELDGDIADIIN